MPKNNKDDSLVVSKPYTKVPDGLDLSPEFNIMTPHAQSLYHKMLSLWNPYKPDEPFAFPYDNIQIVTKFTRNRISRSIKELVTNGFIKIPQKGRYPHNVSLYKIDLVPLQRKYLKVPRGKGTWPGYIREERTGAE